jgi:2,3,4,5-tetrahydropyridine-2-carboxylate N-succinyltransferase
MDAEIRTLAIEEFRDNVVMIEAKDGYKRPYAWGIGVSDISSDGTTLATRFFEPNMGEHYGSAAIIANAVEHLSGTRSYLLDDDQLSGVLDEFSAFEGDGKTHNNIEALKNSKELQKRFPDRNRVVVVFIDDKDTPPIDTSDCYLRLHLLSALKIKPHGINLDGLFGKMVNVAWTNEGAVSLDDLPQRQMDSLMSGVVLEVKSQDKFPKLTDYVNLHSSVRAAHTARLRLGAHIGKGTTVMHEGFVNFNAGTVTGDPDPKTDYEPRAMIEGRISAGVVVGDQSDLGGGCSTMGTLSGGGNIVIAVGKECLIGANAGIGIPLGDRCKVEAGLYITAGTKVAVLDEEGVVVKSVKAKELKGLDDMLLRRNSASGAVECLINKSTVELNKELHAA